MNLTRQEIESSFPWTQIQACQLHVLGLHCTVKEPLWGSFSSHMGLLKFKLTEIKEDLKFS